MRYRFGCDIQQDDEFGNMQKKLVMNGHIQTMDDNSSEYIKDGIAGMLGAAIDYIQDN